MHPLPSYVADLKAFAAKRCKEQPSLTTVRVSPRYMEATDSFRLVRLTDFRPDFVDTYKDRGTLHDQKTLAPSTIPATDYPDTQASIENAIMEKNLSKTITVNISPAFLYDLAKYAKKHMENEALGLTMTVKKNTSSPVHFTFRIKGTDGHVKADALIMPIRY